MSSISLVKYKTWSAFVALFLTALPAALPAAEAVLPTFNQGWQSIPNTKIRAVCAGENGFPQVLGNSGCWSITGAWNGGVFDSRRNRLIVWGGGHNDYFGNELYAFNLDSLTLERLTDPGLPTASSCTPAIANGTQPNSRHTYDGIEYVTNLDKMFVFGGSLSCGAGNFGSDTWMYDFQTEQWERKNPSGPIPAGDAGMMTAYDSTSGLIYLHDRRHLYSYDASSDAYVRLSSDQVTIGYHMVGTIDPIRRQFVITGHDVVQGRGMVYAYDIDSGSDYDMRTLSTSGGGAIVNAAYPGLDFDPTTGKFLAWSEDSGSNVYSLDLGTNQWSVLSFSGGPTSVRNGTHGRWRYSPASGVFVVANDVDDDIYVFKASAGDFVRPNAPLDLTAE